MLVHHELVGRLRPILSSDDNIPTPPHLVRWRYDGGHPPHRGRGEAFDVVGVMDPLAVRESQREGKRIGEVGGSVRAVVLGSGIGSSDIRARTKQGYTKLVWPTLD